MTITEFLEARIAEDENWATMAGHGCGYVHEHNGGWVEVGFPDEHNARPSYELGFIRRYSPERVLAECAAKRAIIKAAWSDHVRIESEWGHGKGQSALEAANDHPEAVEALAAIYADHTDFNPAWKTDAP